MNLIESLNLWGERSIHFAWLMLWQSSLLMVLLLLLDWVFRRHVRAVVRYALWLLLLVKLVLPPSLALPTGPAYWWPRHEPQPRSVPAPATVITRWTEPVHPPASAFTPPPVSRPTLNWRGALLLGWIALAAALTAWLGWRARYVARLKRCAGEAPEWLQELLDAGRRQMGLQRPVSLKISTEAGSPAVCGLFRPVILMPASVAHHLPPLQLRAVLLHELAHLKRGDLWVNYAQTLLQIFYWWHPLLWVANARLRRVREQAVDEAVQVAMGRAAEVYPAALLAVARLALRGPALSLAMMGIIEAKAPLKERIQRLMALPVAKTGRLGVAGTVVTLLAGLVLLPMARGQKDSKDQGGRDIATAPAPLVSDKPLNSRLQQIALAEAPPFDQKVLAQLESLRVEAQGEYKRLETLYAYATNLSRADLKKTVGTIAPDALLNALLTQMAVVEQKLAILDTSYGPGHPEVQAQLQVRETIKKQIEDRLDSILAGLRAQLAAQRSKVGQITSEVETYRQRRADAAGVRPDLLQQARQQLNELLERFTEEHPLVQAKRARIAELEGVLGFRTFTVDPAVFVKNLEIRRQETLRPPSDHYLEVLGALLREAGIDGSPPRSVSFNPQTGEIVAHNTPGALEAMAKIVADLNDPDYERSIRSPSAQARPLARAELQTRAFQVSSEGFAKIFGRNRQPMSPLSEENIKVFYRTLLDFGAEPVPPEIPLATFHEAAGEIVVNNSARGLKAAARLMDDLNRPDRDTINLEFKMMKMTDESLASLQLGAAYPTELRASRFWPLRPDQLQDLTRRLQQQPGVEIISSPRIQTSHGVGCSLFTGQEQPPDSIRLDCLAYTRTEGEDHLIDLTVVTHTTGKFTADAAGDWPEAFGWTNVALFARPTLLSGGGAVLHRQHPGTGVTNNLVILMSVTARKP